jgi:hypothetical protein
VIEPGAIVRVVQLGENGWRFHYPAFARVGSPRGGQHSLSFMLVDCRDVHAMEASEMYGLGAFKHTGFSALEKNLVVATEDEACVAIAVRALKGRDLVITCEPVTLAN